MNRDGETSAKLLELTQRVEELEKDAVINRYRMHDCITEVVASVLHNFDFEKAKNERKMTATEMNIIADDWRNRYMNDCLFHAKVDMFMSRIMQAIDKAINQPT